MAWGPKLLLLAMLVHCVLLQHTSAETSLDWWQTGVIYQIYPRSFKDSNGDGIGDLNGITEKADYLKDLGVAAIWLSPIFKSPMADFGYDISNYHAIEPIFGTMEDFMKLKEAYQSRGIKVILDLVPNHSSDEHDWFQKSVKNVKPYSDFYIWRDAKYANGTRQPPNNWLSYFSYTAWEWNEERKKYYLHQFDKKQPDLNYRNPMVIKEMKDVFRFWLDAGVDGFRVDAVPFLIEDDRFLDEPPSNKPVDPSNVEFLDHTYTMDQPATYDVIYQFRALLDDYTKRSARPATTKFMATEAYTTLENTIRYYGNKTHNGGHFPFNFLLITDVSKESNASVFKNTIESWYAQMPEGKWANWVIGNHDRERAATRFGRDMIDSIHMIQFVIPGTVVTYMGDEIAMENGVVPFNKTVDPQGLHTNESVYTQFSRDPERTPFQWDDTLSAGFSTNETTWLPIAANYKTLNLEKQKNSKKSHYSIYKKLLQLKRIPAIQGGSLKMFAPNKDILVIERFQSPKTLFVAVLNVGSFYKTFDLTKFLSVPEKRLVVYTSSMNCEHLEDESVDVSKIRLHAKAGLVLTNQRT